MSFSPGEDGSKIWTYMHLMAANATSPVKRKYYVEWMNSLKEIFPCEVCRKHLVENLASLPVEPYSNTNVSLFFHSWKLHDTVNGQLKKPQQQCLTYEQAFSIYFPNRVGHANPEHSSRPAEMEVGRYLAASSMPENDQKPPSCNSCGNAPVPVEEKQSFTDFRQQRRRVYSTKN